jgi:hypothetical protein
VNAKGFFFTATATLIFSTAIQAQELTKWSDAGNWEIFVDPDAGDGCLMQTELADSTRVRIGAVPLRDGGFIAVLNKSWQDLEEGATAVLTFDFDGELFAGEAQTIVEGDWRGGYAFFNNPEFVQGISKRKTLVVSGEAGREVTVDLTGTMKAVSAVMDCQKKQ